MEMLRDVHGTSGGGQLVLRLCAGGCHGVVVGGGSWEQRRSKMALSLTVLRSLIWVCSFVYIYDSFLWCS
jgi:hypothetical protein